MGEFRDSIAQQTGLSAQHMEFYYENIPLKHPRQGQPFRFPITTVSNVLEGHMYLPN